MRSPYSIAIIPPKSLFDGRGEQDPNREVAHISAKCTSYSSAGTKALLKSSSDIILWCLNMLLKESVDTEN